MKKCLPVFIVTLSAGLTVAMPIVAGDIAVVINAKNPTSKLSNEVVGDLYLRRATHFPGDGEAKLLDQSPNSAVYENFYLQVAQKTPAQVQSYWSRLVFAGKGRPPKQAASAADIKQMVKENREMMGYVDQALVDQSVKVVLLLPKP